jgi:glycosyltransferase involved in cell wall biosynthesis
MAGKIDRIMRGSALVVVGNRYLFDRAKAAGARRIEIIPTVVDLDRYPVSPPPENPTFTIGWIGTPLTARYLELVRPALQALCARGEARVVAIGAGPLNWNDVPLEVRPWSETTEVADLQAIDVGIMPLPDSPFERGKCGLKLIQYMACARPVVASPVGVNVEIVRDALNGFTATTNEEWISALCALKDDRPRRWRMGEAGRALVQEHFSLHLTAPRLAHLLQSVGDGCRR